LKVADLQDECTGSEARRFLEKSPPLSACAEIHISGFAACGTAGEVSALPKLIERSKYEKLLDKKILLSKKPQSYSDK
jgi:hypothetical protein